MCGRGQATSDRERAGERQLIDQTKARGRSRRENIRENNNNNIIIIIQRKSELSVEIPL